MMTNPDYVHEVIMHLREDTRLHRTREYLERAKQDFAEAGGTYTFSKSEEKTANIGANLNAISKITFGVGDTEECSEYEHSRNSEMLEKDRLNGVKN